MITMPTLTVSPPLEQCAACGAPLTAGYFYLHDRPDRYCATCMATRPRCDSCSAPVGKQHWTLHDGRVLCARCHATAIYDPAVAYHLYAETVAAVVQQLRLSLRVGVAFRLVDAPTMAGIRALDGSRHPTDEQTLGLYQRQGSLRVIYLLYGLPKLTFRTVVAHEYAHAWQGETCPLLDDEVLREGFAEWVAYHHLGYLGCTKAAREMLTSSHPYRPMLERMLELERQVGARGVVDHILKVGRGM